jgi:periplasmic protein TonB
MLAYAAGRSRIGERRSSPNALLLVISAHIAAVAVLMSVKMDVQRHIPQPPLIIRLLHPTPPPPHQPVTPPRTQEQQTPPTVYTPPRSIPTKDPSEELPNATPTPRNGDDSGAMPMPPQPRLDPIPTPVPVSTPAQPLTAASDLRPPYPESKLLAGEEATLTLRLTVDERGRVVTVEPVGRADPVFVSAARRHLLAKWRYKPAMQDGRAVASTLVVTLRFQLDD